ncbi:hypothetical protein CTAYLR_008611 [Chrysophaeum taylorii]|uniref:Uncharacterized protein n=1 Tax=Chrysophaeum taylorii TaxID=2483200 RepID=A0AAD7XP23_9STRA|nr:hypothetical protein CTAYLR_008611 [Chrysophaeum taylorii]
MLDFIGYDKECDVGPEKPLNESPTNSGRGGETSVKRIIRVAAPEPANNAGTSPRLGAVENAVVNERPTVGAVQNLSELKEYLGAFKAGVDDVIEALEREGFVGWRAVRGDGNCYYRAIVFGVLEEAIAKAQTKYLLALVARFDRLRDDLSRVDEVDYDAHDRVATYLSNVAAELETADPARHAHAFVRMATTDRTFDLALVRLARALVVNFFTGAAKLSVSAARRRLAEERDAYHGVRSPPPTLSSGDDLLLTHVVGEEFVRDVARMGTDAEGPVCNLAVLPQLLGANSVVWAIFNASVQPVATSHDDDHHHHHQIGGGGPPSIHVVLNPGHYFLLRHISNLESARSHPPPYETLFPRAPTTLHRSASDSDSGRLSFDHRTPMPPPPRIHITPDFLGLLDERALRRFLQDQGEIFPPPPSIEASSRANLLLT